MSLEISPLAMRRARIRDSLPTEHPQLLDRGRGAGSGRLPAAADLVGLDELVGSLGVPGRMVEPARRHG
ncbi:MAG: hypothetical protein V9G10_04485 [Candidatus Nanopelagicales bacterium]